MTSTLRQTWEGATTLSPPARAGGRIVRVGGPDERQLQLSLSELSTEWEYAIIGGLKFKFTVEEGKFLVGQSRAVTRPFDEIVLGFYDFAGKWFERTSLAFVPHELPWALFGWSEETSYFASSMTDFEPAEDIKESLWVSSTGLSVTAISATVISPQFSTPPPGEARRKSLLSELDRVIEDASEGGWDGYEGLAISQEAKNGALKFIQLLSSDLPDPEITPGAGGEVTFDWYNNPRQIFSVSISNEDRIHYAGLFGKAKISGAEEIGSALPESVRLGINRVVRAHGDQRN